MGQAVAFAIQHIAKAVLRPALFIKPGTFRLPAVFHARTAA
jgi:hypothetical protein